MVGNVAGTPSARRAVVPTEGRDLLLTFLLRRAPPMSDRKSSDPDRDVKTPTGKKLDDLYKLIDGIEVAMFTTRRADGHLVSRPMATQERVTGVDLWFVTEISSHQLDDLAAYPAR